MRTTRTQHAHHTQLNRGLLRFISYAVAWFTVAHFMACLWYLVGTMPPSDVAPGKDWITQDKLHDKPLNIK